MKCIKFYQGTRSYVYEYELEEDEECTKTKGYSAVFFSKQSPCGPGIIVSSKMSHGIDLRNVRYRYPVYIILVDLPQKKHVDPIFLGVRFGDYYYEYHWLERGRHLLISQTWNDFVPSIFIGMLNEYCSAIGTRHWRSCAKLLSTSIGAVPVVMDEDRKTAPQKIFNLCMNEIDNMMQSPGENFNGHYFKILTNILVCFMTEDNNRLIDNQSKDKLDLLEEKIALIHVVLIKIHNAPRAISSFFNRAHPCNVKIDRLKLLLYQIATAPQREDLTEIIENHDLVLDVGEGGVELRGDRSSKNL